MIGDYLNLALWCGQLTVSTAGIGTVTFFLLRKFTVNIHNRESPTKDSPDCFIICTTPGFHGSGIFYRPAPVRDRNRDPCGSLPQPNKNQYHSLNPSNDNRSILAYPSTVLMCSLVPNSVFAWVLPHTTGRTHGCDRVFSQVLPYCHDQSRKLLRGRRYDRRYLSSLWKRMGPEVPQLSQTETACGTLPWWRYQRGIHILPKLSYGSVDTWFNPPRARLLIAFYVFPCIYDTTNHSKSLCCVNF